MLKKNRKRRGNINKMILLAVIASLTLVSPSYAADDAEWEGWTDEKKEEAWTVYVATDWDQVSSLNFYVDTTGSITQANVPADFREAYEGILTNVLQDNEITTVYHSADNPRDKTVYKELLLAMAYLLNREANNGIHYIGDEDACYIHTWISDGASINTPEDSFEFLFRRFAAAERTYCYNHAAAAQSYSIYRNDVYLQAVIQGTLYGYGYTTQYDGYTINNAGTYYSEHSDTLLEEWNNYAAMVSNIYSAISANEHIVIG